MRDETEDARPRLVGVVARKLAVGVLVGGPLIALSYAGLVTWAADEPVSDGIRAGVAFAVVWLGVRGVVGLWRLRRDPERFRRSGVLSVFGVQPVAPHREAGRS